jgi:hypothetical protein
MIDSAALISAEKLLDYPVTNASVAPELIHILNGKGRTTIKMSIPTTRTVPEHLRNNLLMSGR